MVSTDKMVQFRYRIIQYILLCFIWELGFNDLRCAEHSSIRIHKEDVGEITLFILYIAINELGKVLDRKYKCPVYCDVNHIHYYWENNEEAKSNIQTDDGIPRPGKHESGKQSKSNIRPVASTN